MIRQSWAYIQPHNKAAYKRLHLHTTICCLSFQVPIFLIIKSYCDFLFSLLQYYLLPKLHSKNASHGETHLPDSYGVLGSLPNKWKLPSNFRTCCFSVTIGAACSNKESVLSNDAQDTCYQRLYFLLRC